MVSILPVTLPDVVRVRRRPLEWLRSQGLMGVTAELRFGWESAGLAGVSSEMGLDDGLLVCTLLLLI